MQSPRRRRFVCIGSRSSFGLLCDELVAQVLPFASVKFQLDVRSASAAAAQSCEFWFLRLWCSGDLHTIKQLDYVADVVLVASFTLSE